jgi:hypothetical protein
MLVSALTRVRQQETETCVTTQPPSEPGAVSTVPAQWSTRSVCVVVVVIATVAASPLRRIVLARAKTIERADENWLWKAPKPPSWLRRLGAASDHALS